MIDRHELILERLKEVLENIDAEVRVVFRNRADLEENERPGIVLLDGTEEVISTGGNTSSRSDLPRPSMVELYPQIFALLKVRPDGDAEEYGPEMSNYRRAILNAIFQDTGLRELCGTNGHVRYLRTDTDMQTGMTMEGQLQINVALKYLLQPEELI